MLIDSVYLHHELDFYAFVSVFLLVFVLHFLTGLLIVGTHCLIVVLTQIVLIAFKGMFLLHWNRIQCNNVQSIFPSDCWASCL